MAMWAHFSQRATWPPSAAVRQFSIADITLSWPRLIWPALAWRHAGPWPRKISATSSTVRDTGSYAGGGGSLLSSSRLLPGLFLGFLRDCDSRSSGLLMLAIMPVATRVYRAVVSNLS